MSVTCSYDPTHDEGGMFHCPECGEMILAGMPHLDYSLLEGDMEEIEAPIDPPDDWRDDEEKPDWLEDEEDEFTGDEEDIEAEELAESMKDDEEIAAWDSWTNEENARR